MPYSSSTSEEQLPEVFSRLGKTVPPRDKRSYSGSQQPSDIGLRIVRPIHLEQQQQQNVNFQHQPNFQQANYSDIVMQSSSPPPIYYRPQMNNENGVLRFHPNFNPNNNGNAMNNNNNDNIPISYQSPSPSISSSSTPPIPQNAFSFIPRDSNTNPNPNPIISFVRNPNAGAVSGFSAPYQYFNGNMNQVSMNNGHQSPTTTSAPLPTAAATAAATAAGSVSAPVSSVPNVTKSGIAVASPKSSSKTKKDGSVSSESTTISSSTSRSKSEQKKAVRHAPVGVHDSSNDIKENIPTNQRDILAKSIKITASRPRGPDKNGGSSSRKHTRQSDSEDNESDKDIMSSTTVNRKVVVSTSNSSTASKARRDKSRENSPIRKRPKRSISPTIPKRRRSLSSGSDGSVRITKSRYTMRSPSPMSVDRRSRSHSSSQSRSRSRSPPRRRRDSSQRFRDCSPGTSSDEEHAPFLQRQADRYVPDYVRRPLPPQYRRKSPAVRKLAFPSTSASTTSNARKSSPPPAKKSDDSINNRLNQSSKLKDIRSYPPLGTSTGSYNNAGTRADHEAYSSTTAVSSGSKQTPATKPTPISHKIITKPSPVVSKSKTTTISAVPKAANQLKSSPNVIKPKSVTNVENNDEIVPIKQEVSVVSISDIPNAPSKQNKESSDIIPTTVGKNLDNNRTAPESSTTSSKQNNVPAAASLKRADALNGATDNNDTTETENQLRKRRMFSGSPLLDSTKNNKNENDAFSSSFLVSFVNGSATAATTTLDGSQPPIKSAAITQVTRATIKKRAAKEQERLDQERLRQLDIDDRDDIVMDIAIPVKSRPAETVNNDATITSKTSNFSFSVASTTDKLVTSNDQMMVDGSIPAKVNLADGNIATPFEQHQKLHNSVNDTLKYSSTTSTDVETNMTSHENVRSSNTAVLGTNSAFTNLVSSSNNSIPDGNTTERFKSVSSQNLPSPSPPASLQEAVVDVVNKPTAEVVPLPPAPTPLKKTKSKRLPSPWKVKMNDSGDIYYHNPVTGEETFVRPQ